MRDPITNLPDAFITLYVQHSAVNWAKPIFFEKVRHEEKGFFRFSEVSFRIRNICLRISKFSLLQNFNYSTTEICEKRE